MTVITPEQTYKTKLELSLPQVYFMHPALYLTVQCVPAHDLSPRLTGCHFLNLLVDLALKLHFLSGHLPLVFSPEDLSSTLQPT